jgi:hypothetical protein
MMACARVVRRLTTIENRKDAILQTMDRIVQMAQTELLLDANDRVRLDTTEHTYALAEAVWAKVEGRTKANGGDPDVKADVSKASGELMRSPAEMKEVADSAGLSEEVSKNEMALLVAAVEEGFEEMKEEMKEIKGAVQQEAGQTREEIKGRVEEIKGAINLRKIVAELRNVSLRTLVEARARV